MLKILSFITTITTRVFTSSIINILFLLSILVYIPFLSIVEQSFIAQFFNLFLVIILSYTYLCSSNSVLFSIRSLMSLLLLGFMLLSYCISIRLLSTLPYPFTIDQVSTISIIRYLVLVFVTVLGILIFFLQKYSITLNTIYTFVSYPYLQEELRILLNTYCRPFIVDFTRFYIHKLVNNIKVKRLCICLYITPKVVSIISISIFVNFTFFHGDLRLMVYILPFSFITFIFSYYIYWFDRFLADNIVSGNRILTIKSKKPIDYNSSVIMLCNDDLVAELTPFGRSLGFKDGDISILVDRILVLLHIDYILKKYVFFKNNISKFLLLIRISCFLFLIYYFFNTPSEPSGIIAYAGLLDTFFKRASTPKSTFWTVPRRSEHDAAFFLSGLSTQDVQDISAAGVDVRHPVIADLAKLNQDGSASIKAQGSKGLGPVNNPTVDTGSERLFNGTKLPGFTQRVLKPITPVGVNPAKLRLIPGSDQILDQSGVKHNLTKASIQPSDYKSGEKYIPPGGTDQ